jgi:hypothetical protein
MRRLAIRLATLLLALLIVSQFALPPYLEHRVAGRLTDHGGTAKVQMDAIPALTLLFGHGKTLNIRAKNLNVDLTKGQNDVYKKLDDFGHVTVSVSASRAGPFTINSFWIRRRADHDYDVIVSGDGAAGDVARYAGDQLAGGFGQALAGLAAAALGDPGRPIPFDARMGIDTSTGTPRAHDVAGAVDGFPAGPLAQIVANALLGALAR